MRVFAALPFPPAAREQLQHYSASIAPAFDRARPTWVSPHNLHLTLHFFGELDNRAMSELRALLGASAAHCAPLRITTGHLSLLPSISAPRVLYVEAHIQPSDALSRLVRSARQAAQTLGAVCDARPWKAHLTLARLKEPWAPNLRSLPQPPALEFKLEAFDLMSSRLSRGGAQYSLIERFAFRAAPTCSSGD